MGRPRGSSNLTFFEVQRMQDLFRAGIRVVEIAKRVGRSEVTVQRAIRGLKRKRIPRKRKDFKKRNDRILKLVEQGMSRSKIGELLEMSASQVGHVVANHPRIAELLQQQGARPALIAKRYRMELSTVLRIASKQQDVSRSRAGSWEAP